jgi:Sec-independent protein translocase protein TatA
MFGSFGMLEILLVLVVGVVVFGVIKLPRFAKSIGAGWQELKRLKQGFDLGFDEEEQYQQERRDRRRAPGAEDQAPYQQGPGQQYYGQGHAQQWQDQGQQRAQGYGGAAPQAQEGGPPSSQEGNVKKPSQDQKNT